MGKMKVYELAKEINVSSKELLDEAKILGIDLKSHLSSIEDKDVETLKSKFIKVTKKTATKKEEEKKESKKAKKDYYTRGKQI